MPIRDVFMARESLVVVSGAHLHTGAGPWESCPQGHGSRDKVHACGLDKHVAETSHVRTITITQPFLASVPSFFAPLVDEMMACGELSAAQRRRQRRLRAMLGHEQKSMAMALARCSRTTSYGDRRPTGTSASEVYATHHAPLRQTTPHWGGVAGPSR